MNTPPAAIVDETSPLTRKIGYGLGPLLFALTFLITPPEGMTPNAWHTCGLALWMATWWITEAMPLPVASLLPIIILPLFSIVPLKAAAAPYASPIIFLFLGGFIISQAMEKYHLHMRIGLGILRIVGHGGKSILGGLMLATAFMGMWMSNTATVIMMLPMAVSMALLLTGHSDDDPEAKKNNPFAKAMVLAVGYGAVIGGLGTFVGTPTNAILIGHMNKVYGVDLALSDWLMFGVPLMLVILALTWMVLNFRFVRHCNLVSDVRNVVCNAYVKLGPMQYGEKVVSIVFACVAGLWIFSSLIESYFGVPMDDAVIAVAGAMALFLIPTDRSMQNFTLTWKDTQKLPWGILLFFGGSLCISDTLTNTGVTTWLSGELSALSGVNIVLIVAIIVVMLIAISEMMNNVATITAFLPILSATAASMGINPLLLLVPATLAASCGFMLPGASAPNALAYGTGYLKVRDMIRTGVALDLASAAAIVLFAFTLMAWALGVDFSSVPEWAVSK